LYHHHQLNLVDAFVYQQIESFGAFYNETNLFFTYGITPNDEIFLNGAITFGNGIVKHAEHLGYSVSPTGADMEDDTEDINGTGRKHILELWYHKTIKNFDLVGGIIDSTAFVDENEYANDQNIQFINSAFTNNPVAPLVSYNLGIFLKYSEDNKEYKLVLIDNDPDEGYVGVIQGNYYIKNWNIRPYIYNLFGSDNKDSGFGLSADYTKGKIGYFIRIGIPFYKQSSFFSGGFQLRKIKFKDDQIGLAFGLINKEKNAYISEGYYLINLTKHIALTFDIQYMKEFKDDVIFGGRLYLSY
jgi:porin